MPPNNFYISYKNRLDSNKNENHFVNCCFYKKNTFMILIDLFASILFFARPNHIHIKYDLKLSKILDLD